MTTQETIQGTTKKNKQIKGKPVLRDGNLFVHRGVGRGNKIIQVNDGQAVVFHRVLENKMVFVDNRLEKQTINIAGIFDKEKFLIVSAGHNQLHQGEIHMAPMVIGKNPNETAYTICI